MGNLPDYHDEIERLYFVDGKTYQEIGDRFERSREAVRQYLNRNFPDREKGTDFRHKIKVESRAKKEDKARRERQINSLPCVICGEPVLRNTGGKGIRRTCSPEHSVLWSRARFLLDDELRERQRLSMARSILKYREDHLPGAISWSLKIINGEPVNSKPQTRKDSKARLAYEEVVQIRANKEKDK